MEEIVLSREDLIRSGKAKEYRHKRKKYFLEECYIDTVLYNKGIHNEYRDRVNGQICWNNIPRRPEYFDLPNQDAIIKCERICEAVKKQVMRLKEHFLYMLAMPNYDCYLLTWTFTDEDLSNTTTETRKQTIRRTLSALCQDFIANIDFSPETGREHYHALIAVKQGQIKRIKGYYRFPELDEINHYGHIGIERIKHTKKSTRALPRYVDKLALHAFKEKQTSIITKRGTPYQNSKKGINGVTGYDIKSLEKMVFEKWKAEGDPNATINKLLNLFGADFDIEE